MWEGSGSVMPTLSPAKVTYLVARSTAGYISCQNPIIQREAMSVLSLPGWLADHIDSACSRLDNILIPWIWAVFSLGPSFLQQNKTWHRCVFGVSSDGLDICSVRYWLFHCNSLAQGMLWFGVLHVLLADCAAIIAATHKFHNGSIK